MTTAGLLVISNIFTTLAWYGHLELESQPLLLMILMSWLIALPGFSRTSRGGPAFLPRA